MALLTMLTGAQLNAPGITVKGHPTGINNGWFMYPYDFDSTWLIECTGYKEKA
jgi:hypothetical protein